MLHFFLIKASFNTISTKVCGSSKNYTNPGMPRYAWSHLSKMGVSGFSFLGYLSACKIKFQWFLLEILITNESFNLIAHQYCINKKPYLKSCFLIENFAYVLHEWSHRRIEKTNDPILKKAINWSCFTQ